MTPKEYLQQYRDAVRRAAAAQDHLDELRSMATRITPNYSSEGGGTHQTGEYDGQRFLPQTAILFKPEPGATK